METQQQATASTQGKSLKTDIKFQKIKGFEIINKKIMSDYQKLLEENNKLMLKNEELMNQPSSDSKEDQSVRLSEDEETTEATNTISKEAKAPLKVNFGRTGSLFEEIVSLRNIDNLDCIDENFNEEFCHFSTKKGSSAKNRNLSLDYNPSFLTCFTTHLEDKRQSPPREMVDNHKIYEEKKRKANNAYEDFFLLTCQSVKLTFKYMDDILEVDIRPFFKEVLDSRVPFHKVIYYKYNY